MDLTVRPITESEIDLFGAKLTRGFGIDVPADEDAGRIFRTLDRERTVCAFDGTDLIGTCAAFTFDFTVPGGVLPMGGTTMVTVQPTHRRRGVMRSMMTAHFQEMRGRGEPLAGLWASESSIYGRFGFGLAVEGWDLHLDARSIEFAVPPAGGRLRLLEPGEARAALPPVYERVRPTRPGMFARDDDWWDTRVFYDPPRLRQVSSTKRFVVHETSTGADGYAIYRQKEKQGPFPDGELELRELMAATPDAHAALWQFAVRVDLFPRVRYWNAPIDDELPWRLTQPRQVRRTLGDTLWLRVLDVPKALGGRSYRTEGRLVLDLRDGFVPGGDRRYLLHAAPEGCECAPTDAEPDLELGMGALASIYLGGHRATTLARSGLIRGSEEALATADRLFAWDRLPWCPETF